MAERGPGDDAEFALLGPVELRAGGRVVEIRGTGQRALLTALVLNRNTVVSADLLMDALWGDGPPATAVRTLRSNLTRLRSVLAGAASLRWRDTGYLLDTTGCQVDVHRFEAMAARAGADAARGAADAAAIGLRRALALWRGPAIAEFADRAFARPEAERLEDARRRAIEDLAAAELAAGRPVEALTLLDCHLAAHPLREHAWALRMRALYGLGRQAEALAAFREVRMLLDDQLGISPGRALQELEALILRQDPSLEVLPANGRIGGSARVSVPGSHGRTPFVGRERERAALSAALARAASGSGSMILLGGEPGIGKTRLAEEAGIEAAALDMDVFTGNSYEMTGAPPFVAVIEIVEAALAADATPEAFRSEVLGEGAPEVARLVPRLRRLFPDLPPPLELPPEQERRYLFTCLTEAAERSAARRPTLVVLEDLHWADFQTLAFLEHLAPRLHGMALLVVATYRDVEVGRPLAGTLAELHRRRLAEQIRLGRLSERQSAALLSALAGREPPPELAAAVYARTEGHPFFLEEVVRDLAGGHHLLDGETALKDGASVADLDVPAGVRLVVGRRVERLSPAAQGLLTAAAVAGRTFSFRLLRSLVDLHDDEILDAVDEARRAVLILDRAGDHLFTHELIRAALTASLSPARRRRAHLRAAHALGTVWTDSLDEHAAEIVHHLTEAGDEADPKELLAFLVRAGQRALDTSAFHEAAAHLERAATLQSLAEPGARAELLFALGLARMRVGQWDSALVAWQRSLTEYEDLADADAVGRVCLAAGLSLAWANRIPEFVGMFQRGLQALDGQVSDTRARLLARFGSALQYLDPVAADALVDEAVRLVEVLGDDRLRGFVYGELCVGYQGSMRFARGWEAAQVGLPLLRASGDLWGTAHALCFAELHLLHTGRFAESAALGEELGPLAERVGHHIAVYGSGRTHGMREWFATGNLDALSRFGHWDLDFGTRLGWTWWTAHSYSWLGLERFLAGDWTKAEELLTRSLDATVGLFFGGFSWGTWLHFLAATGRREQALAFLDAKRGELPLPGRPNTWSAWSLLMAAVESLDVLGEREEVAAWYPLVLEARSTGAVTIGYIEGRLLERVLGIAAAAGGRWDLAEDHFRVAVAQADALPHALERLETRRSFAAMLARRGSPGDAAATLALLTEAADGYRRLHMPGLADIVDAALNDSDRRRE